MLKKVTVNFFAAIVFILGMSISFAQSVSPTMPNNISSAAVETVSKNSLLETNALRIDDNTQVTLKLSKPWVGDVSSFFLATPARLVIDLPNTVNEIKKMNVNIGVGDARSMVIAQSGNKTRAVINLNRNIPYKITTQGSNIIVLFENVLSANAVTHQASSKPGSSNKKESNLALQTVSSQLNNSLSNSSSGLSKATALSMHEIKAIDFRRSEDGAGRLIVDLVEGSSPINVFLQAGRLVLNIDTTNLPERLRRRLDVTDFATPVQHVSSLMDGSSTRIVLEPKGPFEHSAYQTDSRIVVEVRAIKEDATKLLQGSKIGYKGEKLSLNFQNIDVRSLLQVFADFTNLNIITSDTVQGSITLRLKDVPWDQALDIVMQSKNLDSRKNGNVVLIAPKDELAAKEKGELERLSQLTTLEPLHSEVYQLQYQRAEDVKKMLTEVTNNGNSIGNNQVIISRFLSQRGSATADVRTNQLFVTDVTSKLDEIKKLLSKIDIPIRQVMIEARIVEADDRFGRNLGVKLGFNDAKSTIYTKNANGDKIPVYGAGSNILGTGFYGTLSGAQQGAIDLSTQGNKSGVLGLSDNTNLAYTNFVNLPAGGLGGANPASIALSLFGSGLTRFVNLELSALEADNRGKIISNPRVVTSDAMKAVIESGTEIPYNTVSSSGTTTTFKKAVLKLEVTPQITPEGNVIMDVEVNKDSRGELTPNAGFAIDTKQIKTQVLVENGGTVVIGGVYTQEESNQTTKVPVLGDLPVFGNLFKSNQKVNNRSELLIFLTPRVIVGSTVSDSIK